MTISQDITEAREAARRSDGRFGEQHLQEPDGLDTHPNGGGNQPVRLVRDDGAIEWRLYGRVHRLGGPAVVYPDGSDEWWVSGVQLTGEVLESVRAAWATDDTDTGDPHSTRV